jgi:hypothetical protein
MIRDLLHEAGLPALITASTTSNRLGAPLGQDEACDVAVIQS